MNKLQKEIYEKLKVNPQRSFRSLVDEISREQEVSVDEVVRQLRLMQGSGYIKTIGDRPLDDGAGVFLTEEAYMHYSGLEEYTKKFESYTEDRSKTFYDLSKLLTFNIDHLRQFNSSLLTLDVAIIGAVITAFATRPDIVQIPMLGVIGISIFILNAIAIVVVTDGVLIGENKTLTQRIEFSQRTHNEMLAFITKSIGEGVSIEDFNLQENIKILQYMEEEKKFEKKGLLSSNNYLRTINYSFVIGIIFLAFAFVPFNYFLQ